MVVSESGIGTDVLKLGTGTLRKGRVRQRRMDLGLGLKRDLGNLGPGIFRSAAGAVELGGMGGGT